MDDRKKSLMRADVTILVCDRSRYTNDLWSQFGLALLVDCRWEGSVMRRILFDTGWESGPLLHNMEKLRIPLGGIDACVLSHAHYDHTGGLPDILVAADARFQVIAHADIGRPVYGTSGGLHPIGLEPSSLSSLPRKRRLFVRDSVEIYPGVWVTGTIPRCTDFEKPEKGVFVLNDGRLEPDPEHDDMGLVLDLGEAGMVVMTGCAHAGVVNTVLAARKILPNRAVRGLIGGFHLIDADPSLRQKTIRALRDEDVAEIWTGHCTGWDAEIALGSAFGEKMHRFYTGDRVSLGRDALV